MSKRIICKVWNNDIDQIITYVGVDGEGKQKMEYIWDRIKKGEYFYTLINGIMAKVFSKVRDGKKYLTTNQDGFVPNNLDSLTPCKD